MKVKNILPYIVAVAGLLICFGIMCVGLVQSIYNMSIFWLGQSNYYKRQN